MFLGEYRLSMENGRVLFPWRNVNFEDYKCVYFKNCGDGVVIFNVEYEDEILDLDDVILYYDNFNLSSDGFWKVPEMIKKYLKSDEIILLGMRNFIAVLSRDDQERLMGCLDQPLTCLLE